MNSINSFYQSFFRDYANFVKIVDIMKFRAGNKLIKPPTVRTAAIYSFYINILIHLLFLVMFIYGRNAVIPYGEEPPPRPSGSLWMLIFGILSNYVYVFVLFSVNFSILKKEQLSGFIKIFWIVIVSLALVMFWNQLILLVQQYIFDLDVPNSRAIRGSFVRDLLLGTLTVFSSQIIFLNYRRQLVAIENEALKTEYERARYATLKNQIDPHFLFNSFNTLSSLIGTNTQNAQKYIQKLSSIFRYTMQDRNVTTLLEEINFTKDYCDLMQIRYGENLYFVFNISEEYYSYTVVHFSIQTLVENAIKHNVITSRQPLTVNISTDTDSSITVSNLVFLKKEHNTGEGIGLANLSERYRLKWGEEIIIKNDKNVFSVTLPLINEQKTE